MLWETKGARVRVALERVAQGLRRRDEHLTSGIAVQEGDHGLDLDVVLEGGLAPEHLLRGLDTVTLGLASP